MTRPKGLKVFLGVALLWTVVATATFAILGDRPAAQIGGTTTQVYEAFAFESLGVGSTAVGFTSSTYAPSGQISARAVHCSVETDAISYLYHGGTPTTGATGIGHKQAAATSFTLYGSANIRQFRAIRVTSDATARCTFLR